jgi:acyl-coenzyme A thioesterase PaaI-like protein
VSRGSGPPGVAPRADGRARETGSCNGESALRVEDDGWCFACGEHNPIGLKLKFDFEGEDYVARFRVRREHAGYAGVVHGGLMATLLDESMARLLWVKGYRVLTGRLSVHYRAPVPVGSEIEVRGRIESVRRGGRLVQTRASASVAGAVVAEATALSLSPDETLDQ